MKKLSTRKLWKIMKICATQGMFAILLCGVSFAHDNFAQLLEQPVTLNVESISFEEALSELTKVTNAKFAYSPEQLDVHDVVSIKVANIPLRSILDELLTPRKIRYILQSDGITISLKRVRSAERHDERSDVIPTQPAAPVDFITGTVTNSQGEAMVGVNIIVKGSTSGTTTDSDGKYSIDANAGDVLTFSFIGFISENRTIGTQTVINIMLKEDVTSLNEVVINVGYWEVKEKEQTGNVSRITSKEIQQQNVSNPLQAVQGRMAGVYVQQTSGMPGGGLRIQVRGQNSLRTGSDGGVNGNLPLYIIDGVPFTSASLTSPGISGTITGGNPLSTINPNDIESMEVLKDADATSIYGSRGANGVVLITTKKAKAGKTKIDLNVHQGIGQVSHFVDLLNTAQYLSMRREGYRNDNVAPDPTRAPDLMVWDTTRYTDWQGELIGGMAHITNTNGSISGGSVNTQFALGGSYYRETTVFPGKNSFQRGSGRLYMHHQSNDKRLQLETTANYSISVSDIPSTDFTSLAVTLVPNAPALYDEVGNLNWEAGTWTNPLSSLKKKYKNNTDNLVTNITASYLLFKGLTIKSNIGYTSMTVDELSTNPISAFDPQYAALATGSTSFGNGRIKTWIAEPMLSYTSRIGRGEIIAMAGSTFQQSTQKNQALTGYGYTNDGLLENLQAAATISISSNVHSVYRYTAGFARLNYTWDERYILNLTARRDGSSRFGPGNRFGNFGAVGAAWIFSNEGFAKGLSALSFGKLRASFGTTGNDAIGNYQYLETFSPTRYPYGGAPGYSLSRLANADYSWEVNKKFEAGLDLGLWNDRLRIQSSYYLNRATDQLVGLPLPVMTGQSSVQFNLPATVENTGWEFQASVVAVKKEKFSWNSSVNVTIPNNRLVEFPGLASFPSYASQYDIGNSVYTYKGYQFSQVNPQTGVYEIVDQNNDSQTSVADRVGLKNNTQVFYGGLVNTLAIGKFQFEFLIQFVKQNGFGYKQSFRIPGTLSNQPTIVMDRWRNVGDQTETQRFSAVDPTARVFSAFNNITASDQNIQDASFIRMKNASVSWSLPSVWLQRVHINEARIFIQGQNLFTATRYVGLDPETMSSVVLPPLRMVSAGVSLSL